MLPFLERVTGPGIPADRLAAVAQQYEAFGGLSPINEQNRRLRVALELELNAGSRGSQTITYLSTSVTATGIRSSSILCAICVLMASRTLR